MAMLKSRGQAGPPWSAPGHGSGRAGHSSGTQLPVGQKLDVAHHAAVPSKSASSDLDSETRRQTLRRGPAVISQQLSHLPPIAGDAAPTTQAVAIGAAAAGDPDKRLPILVSSATSSGAQAAAAAHVEASAVRDAVSSLRSLLGQAEARLLEAEAAASRAESLSLALELSRNSEEWGSGPLGNRGGASLLCRRASLVTCLLNCAGQLGQACV